MHKRHWLTIVAALALLMALFAVIGARAQPATSDHIQLYVNGELCDRRSRGAIPAGWSQPVD